MIVTSEQAGFKKPNRGIFDYALNKIDAWPGEVIMIGDNFEVDIRGARAAGIDQIFFNPLSVEVEEKPTFEVKELKNILTIL